MSKVSGSEELKNKEDGTTVIATPIPIIQVICVCMVQMSEALNGEYIYDGLNCAAVLINSSFYVCSRVVISLSGIHGGRYGVHR